MAPPLAKRRKLRHADDDDQSDSNASSSSAHELTKLQASSDEDELHNGDADAQWSVIDEEGSDNSAEPFGEESDVDMQDCASVQAGESTNEQREKKGPVVKKATLPEDGVFTAEVYKSNMFKLQVDELLERVKPRYAKREAPAESAMRTLKTIIEQIPSEGPLSIPEAKMTLNSSGIMIPFPHPPPPKDAKYKLQYERPSSINATGSYPLKMATRTEDTLGIDVVVTMPQGIFQEKDYLNHRYFYKRAFYLARLAAGINDSKQHKFEIAYDWLNGNHLQPIIVVSPNGAGDADDFSSSRCRIQILLAAPDKLFPENKLRPASNCVRPKDHNHNTESQKLSPTPFYNATIQTDVSITRYLKFFHSTSSKCDAFKDACILGRIWLRQRGFASQPRKGGFGNFEFAALMAVLLQQDPGNGPSPLSPGYSSYQLFKAMLQFLSNKDLLKTPFVFNASDANIPRHNSTPAFFDGPRNVNVLFKMTTWSFRRLQAEAKMTIDALAESTFDQFDSVFVLKTDLPTFRFDAMVEIPLATLGLQAGNADPEDYLFERCHRIYQTLSTGLTDRVTTISLSLPQEAHWEVTSKPTNSSGDGSVLVSFATDAANAYRTIDHGPTAENKKDAATYRQFWGDKAELRRFKDGSILESVIWPSKDDLTAMEQIVKFVLQRHMGPEVAEKCRYQGDFLSQLIPFGRIQGQSGITPYVQLMNSLAAVEKDIRELGDLPLQIRHISSVDPQLRYASVHPAGNGKVLMSEPASIIVQFEGSARWPDDLQAIQRTKIAFLLKLSDLLSAAKKQYSTRVGLENPSEPSQNQGYLDIVAGTGFSFRLRIHHDREETLLGRQLKDKSLDSMSRESAAQALAVYKRAFLYSPSHSQAVRTLSTRFPALSPSIRLMKQWFASHMLSPHFSPEFIELLVIRTFLQPQPWAVPACATAGLMRSLAWLARWDWRHTPLVVDFSTSASGNTDLDDQNSSALKPQDLEKIQTRFEAWRRIDPSLNRFVLYVATNMDTDGATWTERGRPEKVVAARMTALARAVTQTVKTNDEGILARLSGNGTKKSRENPFSAELLFTSQLADYDILMRIAPKFSKASLIDLSRFKNIELQSSEAAPLEDPHTVGYSAVQLLVQDLQHIYGEAILWFWNPEVLDVVAGLWNPSITGQRAWKIKPGWNSVPVYGKGKSKKDKKSEDGEADVKGVNVQVNKTAILNEIARLGGSIVEKLEVKP